MIIFLSSAGATNGTVVAVSCGLFGALFDIRHWSRNSGFRNLNLSFTAHASPYQMYSKPCGCLVSLYLFRPTLYVCMCIEYWFLLCLLCSVRTREFNHIFVSKIVHFRVRNGTFFFSRLFMVSLFSFPFIWFSLWCSRSCIKWISIYCCWVLVVCFDLVHT